MISRSAPARARHGQDHHDGCQVVRPSKKLTAGMQGAALKPEGRALVPDALVRID
jgi:hypothetical protein